MLFTRQLKHFKIYKYNKKLKLNNEYNNEKENRVQSR